MNHRGRPTLLERAAAGRSSRGTRQPSHDHWGDSPRGKFFEPLVRGPGESNLSLHRGPARTPRRARGESERATRVGTPKQGIVIAGGGTALHAHGAPCRLGGQVGQRDKRSFRSVYRRRLCRGTTRQLDTIMILPQVHLRKPCYDFYFLQAIEFERLLGQRCRRLHARPRPIRGPH